VETGIGDGFRDADRTMNMLARSPLEKTYVNLAARQACRRKLPRQTATTICARLPWQNDYAGYEVSPDSPNGQ
jgi:hypothetical protein